MSSTDLSIPAALIIYDNLTTFVKCWGFCVFILGIVGHSLSIYTFTRPALRSNPCVRYFLASTISGYSVVMITIPLRTVQLGYDIDLFVTSLGACKCLTFFLSCTRALTSWFIVLACADRFLCSSSSAILRQLSNIRIGFRIILVTTVVVSLTFIHILVYYTITSAFQQCNGQSSAYQEFNSFWNLVMWSWAPSFGMFVFTFLTLRNVRQGKRRLAPQNNQNVPRHARSSTDRQLIQMTIGQCLALGLPTTAYSIGSLYIASKADLPKNAAEQASEIFLQTVLAYIALSGPCLSFYLFTLSSQLFRRELVRRFCHVQQPPGAITMNTLTATRRN